MFTITQRHINDREYEKKKKKIMVIYMSGPTLSPPKFYLSLSEILIVIKIKFRIYIMIIFLSFEWWLELEVRVLEIRSQSQSIVFLYLVTY